VVVAHISEQEHWGKELRRIGIAGKPLHRRSVTEKKLAARIRAITPAMRARASLVARVMAEENGVATAVRLINQTFGG
jgi:UDP:flavonoid glycosyltransferase YjiC (YdhE family)